MKMKAHQQRQFFVGASYSLIFLLFGVLFGKSALAAANDDDESFSSSSSSTLECDLYIAESTIPNAGLGIFTAVEKNVGETVGNGDLCLPIYDLDAHNGYIKDETEEEEEEVYYGNEFHNSFADYVWDGITMGMGMEIPNAIVTALWPGLDCAINCNLPLINVKRAFPRYDTVGLYRSKHPGAGAITPYRAGSTKVIRRIPKGGELFKDYGDKWFVTRPDLFEDLPLSEDFPKAENILKNFFDLVEKIPPSIHEEFYHFVATDLKRLWPSRTLNALPTTYSDAQLVQSNGGELAVLHQQMATRSIEWLKQNGKCVDHIVPGPSTIDGAGEGAFAKRYLPQGTIITGSPLHHIPHRSLLDMYEFERPDPEDSPGWWARLEGTIGHQIVLNYCIGYPESTLLLFPYGLGVNYINHNQSLANVEIRWPSNGTSGHNSNWLNIPPEEMEFQYTTSLGIDYVATKDIKEGDEIFLDYGDAWEKAWLDHVKSWKEKRVESLPSAAEWNNAREPIRTDDEQEYFPYPSNVQLRCHVHLLQHDWRQRELGWARYGDERFQDVHTVYGLPCVVTDRDDDEDTYVVQLSMDRFTFLHPPSNFEEHSTRSGVPREALFFADNPATTDVHAPGVFRHEIQLPMRMFPDAWRNYDPKTSKLDEGGESSQQHTMSDMTYEEL